MQVPSRKLALQTSEDVQELSNALHVVADKLHHTLKEMTAKSTPDSSLAYALLTEEYALRARINILSNDSERHTVPGLNFTQSALLDLLDEKTLQLAQAHSHETLRLIVSDLVLFASSIVPGKAKVINFLVADMGMVLDR